MVIVNILVSVFPVFIFLIALVFLDSYKLTKLRPILATIVLGGIVAAISLPVITVILKQISTDSLVYPKYGAPIIEELLKVVYVVYLIRSGKIGFMVDAAIYGFAIGAGFAFVENTYYLRSISDSNLLLWIIRGFGTAIMHGGTTAIFGIISKTLSDRRSLDKLLVFIPGLAIAIVVHSFFNHFFFSPQVTTIIQLIALPLLVIIVFNQSEKSTRDWLEIGLDTDAYIMEMIDTGNLSDTKIGRYLESLRSKFSGEIVADMLCMLRIHVELSMRAKGILMMRKAGFRTTRDPEIKEKFDEMKYLEKSIGKTGRLAILPFLHTSSRDLWQLYMLGKE